MRKIFEDIQSSDFIEFQKDSDYFKFLIDFPEDKKKYELIFTDTQILEMISELSKLLIKQ